MFCPMCGHKQEEVGAFCSECGSPLAETVSDTAPDEALYEIMMDKDTFVRKSHHIPLVLRTMNHVTFWSAVVTSFVHIVLLLLRCVAICITEPAVPHAVMLLLPFTGAAYTAAIGGTCILAILLLYALPLVCTLKKAYTDHSFPFALLATGVSVIAIVVSYVLLFEGLSFVLITAAGSVTLLSLFALTQGKMAKAYRCYSKEFTITLDDDSEAESSADEVEENDAADIESVESAEDDPLEEDNSLDNTLDKIEFVRQSEFVSSICYLTDTIAYYFSVALLVLLLIVTISQLFALTVYGPFTSILAATIATATGADSLEMINPAILPILFVALALYVIVMWLSLRSAHRHYNFSSALFAALLGIVLFVFYLLMPFANLTILLTSAVTQICLSIHAVTQWLMHRAYCQYLDDSHFE